MLLELYIFFPRLLFNVGAWGAGGGLCEPAGLGCSFAELAARRCGAAGFGSVGS